MNGTEIRAARSDDWAAAHALWMASGGIGVTSKEDSPAGFARFLARNPATCFAAEADGQLVGIVLCGNDGRAGHLYHLIVAPAWQGQGLGRALVDRVLAALRADGVCGADAVIFAENPANDFWDGCGFRARPDLTYRDIVLDPENTWQNRAQRPGDYPELR